VNVTSLVLPLSLFALFGCDQTPSDQAEDNDSEVDFSRVQGFDVDVDQNLELESSLFPLQEGAQWIYKEVFSEFGVTLTSDGYDGFYRVTIIGSVTIEGRLYYQITNFFPRGSYLPDTTLIRRDADRVYYRNENQDHLLYSFAESDSEWVVPLFFGSSGSPYPIAATLVTKADDFAVVSWGLVDFPGPQPRDQSGGVEESWGEIFNRSLGRVRIVHWTEGTGLMAWDLKEVKYVE
jgi:hypothetical protein